MSWGFGGLARVLEGFKGENFRGWSEMESILRGVEEEAEGFGVEWLH